MTHSTQTRNAARSTHIPFLRDQELRASGIAESITSAIGNTPLFRLTNVTGALPSGVEILAKGEHLNPGGSVKDRAALAMIQDGIRRGALTPGKTIIDATSGNTGIAYAMIGSALGYKTTVCLPSNAGAERKRILRAYGTEIIETDAMEGTDGAQLAVKRLAAKFPDTYFYPDQYNNDANWRAHYDGTAQELWRQSAGRITHFVAALGTSGTFVGIVRRLKEWNPQLRAFSVQPDSPLHAIEGVKHMETAIVPGIWDASLADEELIVSSEDAQQMSVRLAREEGMFVGVSSGANVCAAIRLAENLPAGSVVATILCDTGTRSVNEPFWEESDRR